MKTSAWCTALLGTLLLSAPSLAVTIATVPIGNPDNAPDTRYDANGFGAVPYSFRIGKTEVTNAQYVEFLNAVAASDPYELYHPFMSSASQGGVVRSNTSGNFTYSVKPAAIGQGSSGSDYTYDDKPIVFVNWYSAIRFANWLHNGQGGLGTTEDGAYTLLGGTPIPSNANSITRNADARWWLPSEDEWYKAAYYDPSAGIYYDYPTGTNSVPSNNLPSTDTANSVNYWKSGYTSDNPDYPLTDAGAYAASVSPYRTSDQGGNVIEWIEPLVGTSDARSVLRGGSWISTSDILHARARVINNPGLSGDASFIGFRVATIPEPGCLSLLAGGAAILVLWRSRT